jgi:hypothetical protein
MRLLSWQPLRLPRVECYPRKRFGGSLSQVVAEEPILFRVPTPKA